MRQYTEVDKVVARTTQCTKVICDRCGRVAEFPEKDHMPFEWGGTGYSYGSIEMAYYIDGETYEDKIDLCYECAQMIIAQIISHKL